MTGAGWTFCNNRDRIALFDLAVATTAGHLGGLLAGWLGKTSRGTTIAYARPLESDSRSDCECASVRRKMPDLPVRAPQTAVLANVAFEFTLCARFASSNIQTPHYRASPAPRILDKWRKLEGGQL